MHYCVPDNIYFSMAVAHVKLYWGTSSCSGVPSLPHIVRFHSVRCPGIFCFTLDIILEQNGLVHFEAKYFMPILPTKVAISYISLIWFFSESLQVEVVGQQHQPLCSSAVGSPFLSCNIAPLQLCSRLSISEL